jgi:hypothetical protein
VILQKNLSSSDQPIFQWVKAWNGIGWLSAADADRMSAERPQGFVIEITFVADVRQFPQR